MSDRHLPLRVAALAAVLLLSAPALLRAWQEKVDAEVLQAATEGTTQFLVVLTEQAELRDAGDLRTKQERGAFVFARKTELVEATQPAVIAELVTLGAPHRSFWIVNALLVEGDLAVIEALALRADVARIHAVGRGQLEQPEAAAVTAAAGVEPNIALVGADRVWDLGFTGQGVVVAGADTGVEWTHPALRDQYRGWDGTTADHDYNWHDSIPTPNAACPGNSPEPCDDDEFFGGGHGTHTMGTMVGDDAQGNRIGMAPGAEWIACRNMHHGLGVVPTYLDCMEWFLAPTDLAGENPDPSKSPHVINNSWACVEGCPPTILEETTEALRAAGIVYVASAGNDGPDCSTVAFPPAIYRASFTVGATNNQDAIAGFSSRGPVLTHDPLNPYRKPDVVAPGVRVRSSVKGEGYGGLSGTSMAGPHVAGLVALVISADPSLTGDVDRIEAIIESTTKPLTTTQGCGGDAPDQVPNNTFGWGRIDALAAVEETLRVACKDLPDTDPAIEFRGGWAEIEDPDASGGTYRRRMGAKRGGNGLTPTARVVFDGDTITYAFARSSRGGTADIYLDDVLRGTIDFSSEAAEPVFGVSVTYSDLAPGPHELRIEHRSGAVYVDGFETCGGDDAQPEAVGYRSETRTMEASAAEGSIIERTVDVNAQDEELAVVVEGSPVPLTVNLFDPAGDLLASGDALLPDLPITGLDAAPTTPGIYHVQVINPPGAFETVTIRTVRTVHVP